MARTHTQSNTRTSTLTVTLLNKIERIRRIVTAITVVPKEARVPFGSNCSFMGRYFYHRQLLVFRVLKTKITTATLITSYTNLATLKLDTHSSVQTLIDFTRTLLTFRLCLKVGRAQGDGDIGTRLWGLGTWDLRTVVILKPVGIPLRGP